MKRIRYGGDARHAGHVALKFRIADGVPRLVAADVNGAALLEVRLLLCERPRLIRNLAALDDALAGRSGAVHAVEFRMQAWLRVVILQIPVRGDERLPDAAEVGMAVGAM